jgi:hypothetical protein
MKNTENTQYFASDMKISGFKFNGAPVSGLWRWCQNISSPNTIRVMK